MKAKYGKLELGETYKMGKKFYRLTDGNIDEIRRRITNIKEKQNNSR